MHRTVRYQTFKRIENASHPSQLPPFRSLDYEYLNRREESVWKRKSHFEVRTYTGRIMRMVEPISPHPLRTGFHVRVRSFIRDTEMGYLRASDAVVEAVATTQEQLEAEVIRLQEKRPPDNR